MSEERPSAEEIEAAREWLTEREPTWRVAIPDVRRVVLAGLSSLAREPELRSALATAEALVISHEGRLAQQEQRMAALGSSYTKACLCAGEAVTRIAALEAQVERVRKLANWPTETVSGDETTITVRRLRAALDGEGTKP